jgi:cell division protein FtsI/penicillin-binding protein 2
MKKAASQCKRFRALGYIFAAVLAALVLRLFQIQIINGKEYADKALPQQTITVAMDDRQGDIIDRNGIPFTQAGEIQELLIFPNSIGFQEESYQVIEELTGKKKSYFYKKDIANYTETIVRPDSALIKLVEEGIYPGILYQKRNVRYNDTSLARHIIGYLRKSDSIPMSGIEKVYEQYLHPGSAKQVHAVADAKDQMIPGLGYTITEPEETWYNVQLSLDYGIQKILEQALDRYPGHRHGGLVVDAWTGDILALASRPQYKQYDPAAVVEENDPAAESSFLAIPFEQYPLGSVFKIVVAAAALESGKYTSDSNFSCTGGVQVGSKFFPCHSSTGGLGEITLREAFAYSCNDTFIRIAMDIGGDRIIETAESFGLGKALNIELPNAAGILMSKQQYTGPGIANLAIGQGETMVTPLQIADLMTTILNGGQRKQLQLVKGLTSPDGEQIETDSDVNRNFNKQMKSEDEGSQVIRNFRNIRVISKKTADELAAWMGDVTEYGTAIKARDGQIGGTAGKTGTPQVSGDPRSGEYGWFAGFFPQDNPRYVIVVMSKEEGGADDVAVPLFHDIARSIWLSKILKK